VNISIVTSTYFPEDDFTQFVRTVRNLITTHPALELIVVEDSGDNKIADRVFLVLQELIPGKFRLFVNTRNLGQHRSLYIGMEAAKGQYVSLVDSDNEEDISIILDMMDLLDKHMYSDVVYGIPKSDRSKPYRVLRSFFYGIFRKVSPKVNQTPVSTLRIARRSLIEKVLMHKEKTLNIGALFASCDSEPLFVEIDKKFKGESSYNFGRSFKLALQSIISFSNLPLYAAGAIGFIGFCISLIAAIYGLVNYIFVGTSLSGWTSIILLSSIFSGLILLLIGVIAVYLAILMSEIKQRPNLTTEYNVRV
jgi:glycosyltransferase involved in cell wall biosynthesis